MSFDNILETLYGVIASRKTASPESSYVAKLFARGRKKIAQKVGEEGVETALAGVLNDRDEIISESADLLFHMMILWADAGITPEDIAAELKRREGVSGIDEKKAR
jgi:phosphoribosyl-ATP pyrophosphohydrolase